MTASDGVEKDLQEVNAGLKRGASVQFERKK